MKLYTFLSLQIIYIVRNPKDIATSFYRLLRWGGHLKPEEFGAFVESFVNGTGNACMIMHNNYINIDM
jgi:hypothetical protein